LPVELLAQKYGLPSFRFSRFFREDFSQRKESGRLHGKNPNTFYTVGDTMHPNPTGARLAAEWLRSLVVDELRLHVE
jgi:lysophospholipase L1-like esterase